MFKDHLITPGKKQENRSMQGLQNNRGSRWSIVLVVIVLAALPSSALDGSRVFKSAAFPGMGQLADGQVVKGLAFMATEVAALSFAFGQLSQANAHAYNTQLLKTYHSLGGDYTAVQKTWGDWEGSYKKSIRAKQMAFLAGGIAIACWGLNVADAALFPPPSDSGDFSNVRDIAGKTIVMVNPSGESRVCFLIDF